MRIAIIGAGAVGGSIAALLDRSGHDVEVTARGEHLAAIREQGLQLTGAWGDHRAHVEANPTVTKAPDLAIVTTKAPDAPAALRENARWLHGIPVLVVQNGLDALSNAHSVVHDSDVVGGLAVYAASYVSPGSVAVTTAGPIYLGNAESSLAVEYVAGVLGAAMPVTVIHNFTGAQWTKLIVNQINALPAITGLSAQQAIAQPKLRRILTESMREAVGVALAQGVRFAALQGLSHRALRLFHLLPTGVAQLLPLIMKWRMGHTPNPGSTLQSVRRGQKTEIDYLNGAVVNAGKANSVSTPINAALVAMVHEVERTGVFLSTDDVVARALAR
ncbi:MAG: 2-dehydropantoate 2-reductase [Terrimesophilobacter sp.]